MRKIEENLSVMAGKLGYTEEQVNALIEEVAEAYQADGGRKLLEDAFGKE